MFSSIGREIEYYTNFEVKELLHLFLLVNELLKIFIYNDITLVYDTNEYFIINNTNIGH